MAWLLCMVNGYRYIENGYSASNIYLYGVVFLAVLALSVAVVSFLFGTDPNRLGKLAFYTAPVTIALTAVFSFIPAPLGSVLYAISPVFIAPTLARRAYGVVRTARPGYTLTNYMSGFSVAFLLTQMVYVIFNDEPPVHPSYIFFAAVAIPAWFGIRRTIGDASKATDAVWRGLSKTLLLGIIAALAITFCLQKLKTLISFAFDEFNPILNAFLQIPVYIALPFIGFTLLGLIGDKKRERAFVVSALALYLITLQIAFLAGGLESVALVVPLVFVNNIWSTFFVYFILTIPIYFFTYAKRPVFAASSGVAAYLIQWVFARGIDPLIPEALRVVGAPLYVTTAIFVIILLVLLQFIFQRHREKSLAAALNAMLHSNFEAERAEMPPEGEPGSSADPQQDSIIDTLFSPEEKEVSLLLIEGLTQYEIARKLHVPSGEVGTRITSIREKIAGADKPDALTAEIGKKFRLTHREADMLRCLRQGLSNPEIAEELALSEETVKVHIRNLMKKLPVNNRSDVKAWVETFQEKTE